MTTNQYTVVGLWMDDEPPSRVAAWVEADDPDEAARKVVDEGYDGYLGDFLLAGVFEGHITAVDEQ